MAEKLTYAQVGFGKGASVHRKFFGDRAQVLAAVDPKLRPEFEKEPEKLGIRVYTSVNDLPENIRPDFWTVASPNPNQILYKFYRGTTAPVYS